MNFVADESCAMPVIRALRQAGHDVLAIAEDRDFGEWSTHAGIRLPE